MSTPDPLKTAVESAAKDQVDTWWTKIKAWMGRYYYQFIIGFIAGWLFKRFIF